MRATLDEGTILIVARDPSESERIRQSNLGAYFKRSLNCWTVPWSRTAAMELLDLAGLADNVQTVIAKLREPSKAIFAEPTPSTIPLMTHQVNIVRKILAEKRLAVFATMGSGKTACVVSAASRLAEKIEKVLVLIVSPIAIFSTWEAEIGKFCPVDRQIIRAEGPSAKKIKALRRIDETPGLSFVLTNYEGLRHIRTHLERIRWTMVVAEESSHIRNHNAEQSKVIHQIGLKAPYVIALNGTPVTHTAVDLFGQMRFVTTEAFGANYWRFAHRYFRFGGFENREILDINRAREPELWDIVRRHAVLLKKEDLVDLPPKVYEQRSIPLEGPQADAYQRASEELYLLVNGIQDRHANAENHLVSIRNALARLTRCQQIASGFVRSEESGIVRFARNPKLEALIEGIGELPKDEPIVIFARFRESLDAIFRALKERLSRNPALIHGTSSQDEKRTREQAIRKFQQGELDSIICQIQVGGYGLNLQRASMAYFFENWYAFGVRQQAEDRLHRTGQRKTCVYTDIVAHRTVDEFVLECMRKGESVSKRLFGIDIDHESDAA